jgi:hypothetical protein
LDGAPAARWINPTHLTSATPITKELGSRSVELLATIKLQGLPEDRWHLGIYPSAEAANAAWLQFIGYLSANS